MNDLSRYTCTGRLTRDPEAKTINGTALASFSLAVDRSVKKGDTWENDADFFDFEAWGKLAEIVVKYASKGQSVTVDSEPRQDRWDKDGAKHSRVKFVVQWINFHPKLEKKDGQDVAARGRTFTENIPF